ncbi:MAG: hypothetical protein RL691_307 [Actinomycetota bacterium]|jgi:hypothetical protein
MAAGEGSGSTVGDSIEAMVRYDAPPTAGTGEQCSWRVVTSITPTPGPRTGAIVIRNRNGVLETLYARVCGPTTSSYHWIADSVSPRIAEHAKNRVSRLVNMLLAKTAPPADKMVVNVGTWFWVPRSIWKPISVTAYIPTSAGPISVTTTATPKTLMYSPGDGNDTVSCAGPGRPWTTSLGDTADSPCMYTYDHSSRTRSRTTFRARMAIKWAVTWRSSLGVGGSLPSIRTGTGLDAYVRELQALSR